MSTVCFVNGYVLSDEHPRFEKKNVLCENGKIKSIFSEGVKPLADTYVDIEGRYLVPELLEKGYTVDVISLDEKTSDNPRSLSGLNYFLTAAPDSSKAVMSASLYPISPSTS